MWRLLPASLVWFVYLVIDISLAVLGLALVPLAIAFRRPMKSPVNGRPIINAPRWLWLWGNDEDGLAPSWYDLVTPTWSAWRRMYVWSALRNSVNNLRYLPGFGVRVYASKLRTVHCGRFELAWQDIRYRLAVTTAKSWLAIGWKYENAQFSGQRVGFGVRRKSL